MGDPFEYFDNLGKPQDMGNNGGRILKYIANCREDNINQVKNAGLCTWCPI